MASIETTWTENLIGNEDVDHVLDRLGVKLVGYNRGGPSFASPDLHVCAVCWHQTERTFRADSDTHRILNRSLNPVSGIGLCVRCWSSLARD